MKPSRLFGIRVTPADVKSQRRGEALAGAFKQDDWREVIGGRRGVFLLGKENGRDDIIVLPDELGVLLGPVFQNASQRPIAESAISAEEAHAWCESPERAFAQAHWGSYLAILHDRFSDTLHLLRDPMGAGACFLARKEWGWLFFTHAADYLAHTPDAEFDRDYLGAFLVSPRLVAKRTAIEGVEELEAGAQLSIHRTHARYDTIWRPATPCKQWKPADFQDAALGLRQVVATSAAAWCSTGQPILHRLSGGLDLSIVLAALAASAPSGSITCINEFPSNVPEGDERAVARMVASTFGAQLIELGIGPSDVDYARVLDVEVSAKPSVADLSFGGRAFAEFAARAEASLLTSGQGGDQVLHRSRTPEIAADAVRDGLPLGDLLNIALGIARLGRRPVWDVFSAQISHGLLRRRFDPTASLISADALIAPEAIEAAMRIWNEHPWLAGAGREAPARAKRMMRIADLQFYHQPSILTEALANALVLASQPIVEFCLSVPPYVMTQGGRERSLARTAFANDLPHAVLGRSLKGDTTRHFTAVLERNRDFMRSVLIGGRLASAGLIQAPVVEAALDRSRFADGKVASGLTHCLIAELWIRRFEAAKLRGGSGFQQALPAVR